MLNITFVGNVGRQPVLRATPSGKAVTKFPVAINDRSGNTTWVQVEAWGKLAETCANFLQAGRLVAVNANRVRSEAWSTEDAAIASATVTTAYSVEFLGPKPKTADAE